MNEDYVVLTLKKYEQLKEDYALLLDEVYEHRKRNDESFAVVYEYDIIPTFYTKKELNNEIIKMFDTLNNTIEKLQKENTQLKKPFWKRK